MQSPVGAFIGRPHGEPPYPIREDSMILKTHIMPERSIVFCLCNSVGAFIGRSHGEPPYPIREDSMILKTHIMPERSIVFLFVQFCRGVHWTPALMKSSVYSHNF